MAQSALECANAALVKIGQDKITDLAGTDHVSVACNDRIDICKRYLLRLHPWNFAVKRSNLEPTFFAISNAVNNGSGLIQITSAAHGLSGTGNHVTIENVQGVPANGTWEVTVINATTLDLVDSTFSGTYTAASDDRLTVAPNFDFAYQVALPSDCLRVLRVNDTTYGFDWRVEGRKIITHDYPIELKYIYDVTDYTTMDIGFYETLATYLAWDIAYKITQSSTLKAQLHQELWGQGGLLSKARFTDATEDAIEKLEAEDWVYSRTAGSVHNYPGNWVN